MAAFLLLIGVGQSQGRVWVGGTSSDWFDGSNWNPAGIPQTGDDVTIPSATSAPLLTSSTPSLASLTVSTGTLTCSNWTTVINATVITIQNTGKITLPVAFASNVMSNRIHIVCSNLTVDVGGTIDANEMGYGVGYGPGVGTGSDRVGGGGYGGRGGYASFGNETAPGPSGGITYGSESAPTDPGSGGPASYGGNYANPGKGGGAILIEATDGVVTVNGTISANGGDSKEAHASGGSGGAIYITCRDFQGSSSGLLSAKGGNRGGGDSNCGGAGGGGRIAVIYQTCNLPSVRLSAACGTTYFAAGDETFSAEIGTVYLSTAAILTPMIKDITGRVIIPGLTSWSPASLTLSNSAIVFGSSLQLNVGGDLMVTGATSQLRLGPGSGLNCAGNLLPAGGKIFIESNSTVSCNSGMINGGSLVVAKSDLRCGADFTVTNGGIFYAYSTTNDATALPYGSHIVITGNLYVAGSSWIYSYSEPINGGSPVFQAQNITVDANAGFNAVGRGYGVAQGSGTPPPNGGDNATGGSHAGKGGKGSNGYTPGSTYGSSNAPVTAGSGSGNCYAGIYYTGKGGGVIRLEVPGRLTLAGTLDASGAPAIDGHGAGGAGGSIFVIAGSFNSTVGSVLNAKGGGNAGGNGGGGGGGRIAIWVGASRDSVTRYVTTGFGSRPEIFDKFLGSTSVTNGLGYYNGPPNGAEPGTVQLLWSPGQGTVFSVR